MLRPATEKTTTLINALHLSLSGSYYPEEDRRMIQDLSTEANVTVECVFRCILIFLGHFYLLVRFEENVSLSGTTRGKDQGSQNGKMKADGSADEERAAPAELGCQPLE